MREKDGSQGESHGRRLNAVKGRELRCGEQKQAKEGGRVWGFAEDGGS